MDVTFENGEPEEAREALKRIARQFHEEIPEGLDAIVYYRGMSKALNEDDFRWGLLHVLKPPERRKLRRQRLDEFREQLELFEREMKRARADRRFAIAWRGNWAGMEQEVWDEIRLGAQGLMLRLAGLLYRLGFPGAMDLCDAAASEIFAIVYLRPPPAAE
jgi:hypothetical protein